jgi:hypothetical protein
MGSQHGRRATGDGFGQPPTVVVRRDGVVEVEGELVAICYVFRGPGRRAW